MHTTHNKPRNTTPWPLRVVWSVIRFDQSFAARGLCCKHNYHYLSRGRSLNFRFWDFLWAVQTSKAAAAAGPFEQFPQLLGHSNGCSRASKRQLCYEISMLVVVTKAANVSSAAAAVRVFPPTRCCSQRQQIPCRTWC